MEIRKNKRGIGFATLSPFSVLVFTLLMFIVTINPTNDIPEELDYGEAIKSTDMILSKIPAEEFYKKEELKTILEKAKFDFINNVIAKESFKRKESKASDSLIGCSVGELELWYNQKNEDENSLLKNQDPKNKENGSAQENKYSNCIPAIGDELEENLRVYLEEILKEELGDALKAQDIDKEPQVEVEYDPKTSEMEISIKTYYREETKLSKARVELLYEDKIDLGSYPQLIKTTQNAIHDIPLELKDNIPKCMEENDYNESYCITEVIEDAVYSKSDLIEKDYDINTALIKGLDSDEYIGLKISAINKETRLKELEFGMVIKDNIPYSLINFEVENSKVNDNTINLEIERPRFYEKVSSYVILYSHENFFSPQSKSYSKLIELLQDSKVPKNFNKAKIPIDAKTSSAYYYPSPKLGIDNLNLIVTNNDGFEEFEKTYKKRIKIFQGYDSLSKRYTLLDKRPVYAFVFATDKNYNYYLEDSITDKIKSITPKSQYGPKPLNKVSKSNDILNEIAMQEYENTFLFMAKDYDDPRFDHYDLYITSKDATITPKCENSQNCYYFNGKSKLNKQQGFTYLITSDPALTDSQNFDDIIYLSDFQLENGEEYKIHAIPVDSNGKGTLQLTKRSQQIREANSEYFILEDTAQTLTPFEKTIEILDKKAPDPLRSITVNGELNNLDNQLYLQWEPLDDQDIIKLDVKILKYKGTELDSAKREIISIDGSIPNSNPSGFTKIVVDDILPIDSAGNMAINPSQTHSAQYTTQQ